MKRVGSGWIRAVSGLSAFSFEAGHCGRLLFEPDEQLHSTAKVGTAIAETSSHTQRSIDTIRNTV